MIIDCGSCAVAGPACDDCVVSVLLGMPEGGAVGVTDVSDEHTAAIEVLAESGLIPPLRLLPRSQASQPGTIPPPRASDPGTIRRRRRSSAAG